MEEKSRKAYIAGMSFIEGILELEPRLQHHFQLDFYRAPENRYDPWPIVVRNVTGLMLGYLLKADQVIFSRLMDAGKLLYGRVSSKAVQGNWLKVEMKGYLQE